MREAELVYRLYEDGYTEGNNPVAFVTHLHVVRGAKGAVSFSYVFPADPAAARASLHTNDPWLQDWISSPQGRGVDYHSPIPLHDWQTNSQSQCLALGKGPCYGDGSGLRAVQWLEEFQTYGTEWLVPALGDFYHEVFYDMGEKTIENLGFGETMQLLGDMFRGAG